MKTSIKFEERFNILKKWIIKKRIRIFLMLFLYPNIVCYTPDSTSTSSTVVETLFGWSKFANVSYSCNNEVLKVDKFSFNDYGGSVTHNIELLQFGLRTGGYSINYEGSGGEYNYSNYSNPYYYQDNHTVGSTLYANPFIGLESQYIAFNLGLVLLSNLDNYDVLENNFLNSNKTQPSFYLRIGNRKKMYYTAQYLSNIPLLSEGMISTGLGFGSEESRNLTWIGFSAGPFQNLGISLKQTIQLTDGLDLLLNGRIGQIENNFEGGFSFGARYTF